MGMQICVPPNSDIIVDSFSMGWSKLQVVQNLIIADSGIVIFKGLGNPDHIEKFAICTEHIGLRIEQQLKPIAETAPV